MGTEMWNVATKLFLLVSFMVCEKLWPDVKMIDSLLFWIFSEKKGIRVGLHFSLLVFTEEKTESKSYFLVTGCLTQRYVHSTRSCPWSPGLVLRRTYHLEIISWLLPVLFFSVLRWFNKPSLAERPRTGSNRIPFSDEGSDARESSDFVAEERRVKQAT